MSGISAVVLWLAAAVVFFIVEGISVQFFSIWFAFGALAAIIPSLLGAPFWVQMLVFLLASVAVLFVGRPMLKQRLTPKKVATNLDMVIGQVGVVIEEIDNLKQTGRVSALGLDWTARSVDGSAVAEGQQVLVQRIEGVKLMVEQYSAQ